MSCEQQTNYSIGYPAFGPGHLHVVFQASSTIPDEEACSAEVGTMPEVYIRKPDGIHPAHALTLVCSGAILPAGPSRATTYISHAIWLSTSDLCKQLCRKLHQYLMEQQPVEREHRRFETLCNGFGLISSEKLFTKTYGSDILYYAGCCSFLRCRSL